jgi:hypothetical protein
MYSVNNTSYEVGFPIRIFMDYSLLSAPHNFSQTTASFIACDRQGIHYMHLVTWFHNLYVI